MDHVKTAATIRDELLTFRWSNYGLDEVDEADTEWADHLADEIATALNAKATEGSR